MSEVMSKRERLESLFIKDASLLEKPATVIVKAAKSRLGMEIGDTYASTIRKNYRESGGIPSQFLVKPVNGEASHAKISIEVGKPTFTLEDIQKVAACARAVGGIDKLVALVTEIKNLTQGL